MIKKQKVKKLKKNLLGSFRNKAIKNLEELSKALVKSEISPSMDEAKQLIPILTHEKLFYGDEYEDKQWLSIKYNEVEENYIVRLFEYREL